MNNKLKTIQWGRSVFPAGHLQGLMGHVHYYTSQWKVSVGWKTGRSKDFWLGLPKRLRAAQSDSKAFEGILAELDKARNTAVENVAKIRHFHEHGRAYSEVMINAEFALLFQLLPSSVRGKIVGRLTGREIDPLNMYWISALFEDGKTHNNTGFVEPDMLLASDKHLAMIEIKREGGHKYGAGQMAHYGRLVAAVQILEHEGENDAMPSALDQFLHIVLLPEIGMMHFEPKGKRHGQPWIKELPSSSGGLLKFDPEVCVQEAGNHVAPLTDDLVKQALERLPVYVVTWDSLADAVEAECNALGEKMEDLEHWRVIAVNMRDVAKRACGEPVVKPKADDAPSRQSGQRSHYDEASFRSEAAKYSEALPAIEKLIEWQQNNDLVVEWKSGNVGHFDVNFVDEHREEFLYNYYLPNQLTATLQIMEEEGLFQSDDEVVDFLTSVQAYPGLDVQWKPDGGEWKKVAVESFVAEHGRHRLIQSVRIRSSDLVVLYQSGKLEEFLDLYETKILSKLRSPTAIPDEEQTEGIL